MATLRKIGTAGVVGNGAGLSVMIGDASLKIVDGGGINSILVTATTGAVTTAAHIRVRTAGTTVTALTVSSASSQFQAAADVVVNPGGNLVAATTGFLFVPSCAGTPTGVPANTYTNCVALQYDRTAHKIWVYDTAWKATAALT